VGFYPVREPDASFTLPKCYSSSWLTFKRYAASITPDKSAERQRSVATKKTGSRQFSETRW